MSDLPSSKLLLERDHQPLKVNLKQANGKTLLNELSLCEHRTSCELTLPEPEYSQTPCLFAVREELENAVKLSGVYTASGLEYGVYGILLEYIGKFHILST